MARHRADVPDVVQDAARVGDQESGEFAIIIPGTGDGAFIDFLAFFVEEERDGRDIGLRAVEADVALALLLGIVERVGVEEGPDKLAADVFEAEFEMGVLEDGVMAAVESGGADVEALLVGDFFGVDEARGVAGAGGGDGGIEGVSESVAEGDARRGGFDLFGGVRAVEHAGLGGHEKNLTQRTQRAQRTRRSKKEDRQECLSYQGGLGGTRTQIAPRRLRDCLELREQKREVGPDKSRGKLPHSTATFWRPRFCQLRLWQRRRRISW
jgi:hypothetical protein